MHSGALATSAALSNPPLVSARADGSFVFVDQGNNRVRRVTAAGVIQLVGGTGTAGYNGDGFAANQAQLNRPSGIVYDAQGNCLVADRANRRLRRIAGCIGTGTIATIAGIPSSFTGDGRPALGRRRPASQPVNGGNPASPPAAPTERRAPGR